MGLLALSVLALAIGPLVHRATRGASRWTDLIDGFVFVTVLGLVGLQLLPHAYEASGWPALAAAALAFVGLAVVDRRFHRRAHAVDLLAAWLALAGFALHEALDGVALATVAGGGGHGHALGQDGLLPLAIILHRLPVGMVVWNLFGSRHGRIAGAVALSVLAAATIAGYGLGERVHTHLEGPASGLFEALVAGALAHLALHPTGRGETAGGRAAGGVGALVAVGLLALMQEQTLVPAARGESGAGATFVTLALETAPALLVAYVAAGLVNAFLGRGAGAWLARGGRLGQAMRGVALGLPLPICSCGVVPVYRSLIKRGAPAAAALAFLVATPELGIDAILLSWPLLGAELALARLLMAAAIALAVAMLLARLFAEPRTGDGRGDAALPVPDGGLFARARTGLRWSLSENVDHTAPHLLLGLGVAALAEPLLRADALAGLPGGLDVPLLALVGLPVYVCASGATPLAAVLIHKGISPGAALAFLITGPATNVTTFGVLAGLHGRRAAALFGLTVAGLAVAAGFAINALVTASGVTALHAAVDRHAEPWRWLCVGALAALMLLSLLRMGPRGFLRELAPGAAAHGAAPSGAGGHVCSAGHFHPHDHHHHHHHDDEVTP